MSNMVMKVAGKNSNNAVTGILVENDGTIVSRRMFEDIPTTYIIPANTELRDSSAHTTVSVQCDTYKYPINSIIISTLLDADVEFTLLDGSHISNQGWISRLDGEYVRFTIPANNSNASKIYMITPEDIPEIDYIKFLKFRYQAKSVPTKGTIHVEVVHKG